MEGVLREFGCGEHLDKSSLKEEVVTYQFDLERLIVLFTLPAVKGFFPVRKWTQGQGYSLLLAI